jgi:2-oxoglutarate ferredoxin oxidoreductase subunit alpha
MLFPEDPTECFELTAQAFDLAERLQTPVFVMTDLDLGMNNWMADPFPYPEKPIDRGKVIRTEEELKEHIARFKEFARYKDVDGDGIPYRTLPGLIDNPAAAFFTRGSGHTERATYSERPDDYRRNMERLARKFETARREVPRPVVEGNGEPVGVIAYGSSDFAVQEARHLLSRRRIATDSLRLRALPLTEETFAFVAAHDRVYVVDQNRDGQMHDLLRLELPPGDVAKLRSIRHYDGFPLDAETVVEGIEAGEKK